ncbi:MAG: lysine biosynthesis protein LysX [Planctomycetota bacterium]|nr:lysine biosynthesis protein LysX [Planctomycetota bacterium]
MHTRLRIEERHLADALEARGAAVELVDLREVVFDPRQTDRWRAFDVVLDRCVSLTSSLTAVRVLEHMGIRCINSASAIELCSDKLRTTLALEGAGVATPAVRVAVSPEAALRAIEEIGYPAVLKPTIGSWGRLVSRVNDRDAAEAIVEHRDTLGSVNHHVYYVQEHVEKPGRDIRVFVVGGEAIAAITRSSAHWVTNTARGATAAGLAVLPELGSLCTAAAACVGADVCAIDVLECPRRGYLVNEINHSMEFRNSILTSGVDIPGLVAAHVLRIAQDSRAAAGLQAGVSR